ncbi:MAG: SRPBCC domain-containing protein [Mycobacterium sp.]|uniref:SRPBCC family protein n=1 Tax=Mycobacterium sp. TaxID=1785 RepID=UPI001EC3BCB4|nr:SRPBCC domain-containing protein [Mycobacterium sp.]MBV8789280.1 SRPBCC domain-containing protein [Mycobacterium sp.]
MSFRRVKNNTLSGSIRLAAPPEKVWDLITTVASITDWYDTWDAVEHAADDERLQVGTSFRLIRHRIGRAHTAVCRVIALQAPTRLRWVQYAPHQPTVMVEFWLLADTEGSTSTWLNHTKSWVEPSDHRYH